MVRNRANRRLATVLFVDIVDSTGIASQTGDRRWRELLMAFRRVVRRQLRSHGGHEEDTAGDGFFATFARPAGAVTAAAGIVAKVQALGIDVRCGVHTGELQRIDGHLGGVAAHIGARVMALAGPAEILVTGTVHDLAVGGGISFLPSGDTELRGVPGRWALHRVIDVEGALVPSALEPEEARRRRGTADHGLPRWPPLPRRRIFGVAVMAALALGGLGAVIITLPRDAPSLAGGPSSSPYLPPTMLKIDSVTNEVVAEIHDRYLRTDPDAPAWIVDGTLWQETITELVRRDIDTGQVLDVIDKPANTTYTLFGFGSIWFAVEDDVVGGRWDLHRVDPVSGRTLAVIDIEPSVRDIAFGRDAIYVLSREGEILEIDPRENGLVDTDRLPIDTIPDALASIGRTLWICECDEGRILQWDPNEDVEIRTVEFAQRGFIMRDQREASQGTVSVDEDTVWLLDWEGGTITPVDTATGEAGQPVGIPQNSYWHDFGIDSIWITASTDIYRLRLDTMRAEVIPLPEGVDAGGIAVDESSGAVWVVNVERKP